MSKPFEGSSVASYLEGPPRQVPGYDGLLRMTSLLLSETLSDDGRVLVLGEGGGLEIRAMATEHPGWQFVGVDPSADMIALAEKTTSSSATNASLITGYIQDAPDEQFDAATCILTMHFVPKDERLATLQQIRRRLKLGAPLVMAHISFDQEEPARSEWIARHVAFAGTSPGHVDAARKAISERLTILSPDTEEKLLQQAGFRDISLIYAGLSFRGWIAFSAAN